MRNVLIYMGIAFLKRQETRMEENTVNEEQTSSEEFYGIKKDYFLTPVNKKKEILNLALYILISSFAYVFAFHYFVATCRFAPGGVGGIVAIVKHLMGATEQTSGFDYSSLLFLIVNIPLLIPAWKIVGKDFSLKTLITAILMTIMMILLDNVIDPQYKLSLTGEPNVPDVGTRLIGAMLGGAVTGISLGCALKVNSSTGGADIVGAMVQKKHPHKSVASMIFAVNFVIMAVSIPVYKDNLMPVFLSLIYMVITTYICDRLLLSNKSALKFEVVTEHAEEISKEIIEQLGHGVTITPAIGMFEHKQKQLLICVISPRQVTRFQTIIRKYPGTFAYVGAVNEIIGKFNTDKTKQG